MGVEDGSIRGCSTENSKVPSAHAAFNVFIGPFTGRGVGRGCSRKGALALAWAEARGRGCWATATLHCTALQHCTALYCTALSSSHLLTGTLADRSSSRHIAQQMGKSTTHHHASKTRDQIQQNNNTFKSDIPRIRLAISFPLTLAQINAFQRPTKVNTILGTGSEGQEELRGGRKKNNIG